MYDLSKHKLIASKYVIFHENADDDISKYYKWYTPYDDDDDHVKVDLDGDKYRNRNKNRYKNRNRYKYKNMYRIKVKATWIL